MHKVRKENHVFNRWWNINLLTHSIPKLQSQYEDEAVYFLPFGSQEFQVLNWSTSEGWKAELTLRPSSSFEPRTPGLEIQYLTTRSLLPELMTFKKLRAFKKLKKCLIKWDFDSFLLWDLPKKGMLCIFNIFISSGKFEIILNNENDRRESNNKLTK